MKGGYGFRGPRSGAYGGGKNGGYYNPKGGSWGMNGKGSWGGSSSWGNTGGGYGSDGGGKGAIKDLCGMMAYKMEQEMWKEEKKEWDEYEKKQEDERKEREKRRVEEMDRFKEEMRQSSASVATSIKESVTEAFKSVKEEVSDALGNLNGPDGSAGAALQTPAAKRRLSFTDTGSVRAAAKAKMRPRVSIGSGGPLVASGSTGRHQNVIPPIDEADWKDFVFSRGKAEDVVLTLALTSNPMELAGLGLMEACEVIGDPVNGDMNEWKSWYEDVFNEAPKARWSKVAIISAIVARHLEESP